MQNVNVKNIVSMDLLVFFFYFKYEQIIVQTSRCSLIYTRNGENLPHKDNPDAKRESLSTFTRFVSTLKNSYQTFTTISSRIINYLINIITDIFPFHPYRMSSLITMGKHSGDERSTFRLYFVN